jgi:hypothetical protein
MDASRGIATTPTSMAQASSGLHSAQVCSPRPGKPRPPLSALHCLPRVQEVVRLQRALLQDDPEDATEEPEQWTVAHVFGNSMHPVTKASILKFRYTTWEPEEVCKGVVHRTERCLLPRIKSRPADEHVSLERGAGSGDKKSGE